MRVTMRTSPLRSKSSTVRNSSRPSVVARLLFSARITSHRAALKAASWIKRSRSVVLTRAYPMMIICSFIVSFGFRPRGNALLDQKL